MVPPRVDRKTGADLVTRHFFPISPRTLEAWPLTWRLVNGKAVCETAELFEVAQAKLDAAPICRTFSGRRAGEAAATDRT
jgi:hypothetical protein